MICPGLAEALEVHLAPTYRLADLITRYGGALEWDLQTRCGVDLGEYWRDRRRHRKLLNLIDHLPGDAQSIAAMLNDPEAAAAVREGRLRLPADAAPSGPDTTEWSPLREGLARIEDQLGLLLVTTIALKGAKPVPKFKPAPRPTTAMAEAMRVARAMAERAEFDEIVRLFAPHEFTDDPPPGG